MDIHEDWSPDVYRPIILQLDYLDPDTKAFIENMAAQGRTLCALRVPEEVRNIVLGAAVYNEHMEVPNALETLTFLIEQYGNTFNPEIPLFTAIDNEDPEALAVLLQSEHVLNAVDSRALYWAITSMCEWTTKLLLDTGRVQVTQENQLAFAIGTCWNIDHTTGEPCGVAPRVLTIIKYILQALPPDTEFDDRMIMAALSKSDCPEVWRTLLQYHQDATTKIFRVNELAMEHARPHIQAVVQEFMPVRRTQRRNRRKPKRFRED